MYDNTIIMEMIQENGELLSSPQQEGLGNYIEPDNSGEVVAIKTNYYHVAYHKKAPDSGGGGSKLPNGIKDWNAGI